MATKKKRAVKKKAAQKPFGAATLIREGARGLTQMARRKRKKVVKKARERSIITQAQRRREKKAGL